MYNWFNERTHKIGEAVRLKKSKNALLQATGRNSMNKQQLASKIWESANKMRSKIEANEYKDYILGFMFYKFLSDKEVKWLKENDWTDEYCRI